jgi:hypothetical protein
MHVLYTTVLRNNQTVLGRLFPKMGLPRTAEARYCKTHASYFENEIPVIWRYTGVHTIKTALEQYDDCVSLPILRSKVPFSQHGPSRGNPRKINHFKLAGLACYLDVVLHR